MTGPLWVPGAARLECSSPGGTSDYPEAGPRAVAHTTECPSGGHNGDPNYWFKAMARTLVAKRDEPTLLYDPSTDKLGQFMPLNATGRALMNDGGRRSNRVGRVCIQIEFVGYASRPFTRYWRPGPNLISMMQAIRAWGVPDHWPSGLPPAYPGGRDERSAAVWYRQAGWYGHSQVPGNSHGDPGAIADGHFFSAGRPPAAAHVDRLDPGVPGSLVWPAWARYPGAAHLGAGRGSDSYWNMLIKSALIANGHRTGFPKEIGTVWDKPSADRLADFKAERGLADETGITAKVWTELGRMPANAPDFPGPKSFVDGKANQAALVGQSLLMLQGFHRELGHRVTRAWRPAAHRALRRFQLSEPRLKADPDGEWGPLTWQLAWTDNT